MRRGPRTSGFLAPLGTWTSASERLANNQGREGTAAGQERGVLWFGHWRAECGRVALVAQLKCTEAFLPLPSCASREKNSLLGASRLQESFAQDLSDDTDKGMSCRIRIYVVSANHDGDPGTLVTP
ncbi:hypothetical protein DR999_PMT20318 [Platysternon megacephalum]|uniref:Uncharacterized protein n=1 Tax=Platysternon megacephalum TaxID=55544 RepID=A0A4D9DKI8_9SAUR|nr:hypothetical protein DR999_PMT20318 [Platysternon megacephalum]